MYYGTTQLYSSYPQELVSCICITVLRNYALPIHENYSFLYMYYGTTQLRSTYPR